MSRCEQCNRPCQALLYGLCGRCMRARSHARMRLQGGHGSTTYILANEELPLHEVFSTHELKHLAFLRWLIAHDKVQIGA